jgi:hypothetical protein
MSRDRSNEWIGATFVGLGLGAAGVAGALAWVTSAIGAPAIPIWFAAVAGVVFLSRSPLGLAFAKRIGGDGAEVGQVPDELYQELDQLRAHVAELEERMDFSERLLVKDRATADNSKVNS